VIILLKNFLLIFVPCLLPVFLSLSLFLGLLSAIFFRISFMNLFCIYHFFFTALGFLEIGRVMGAGFGLAAKTTRAPIIAAVALSVQMVAIYTLFSFGLWGIILGNMCAFIVYGCANYFYSRKVYVGSIVDVPRLFKLISCLVGYVVLCQFLFFYTVSWYYLATLICSWPVTLWKAGIVGNDEKMWLVNRIRYGIKQIGWLYRFQKYVQDW